MIVVKLIQNLFNLFKVFGEELTKIAKEDKKVVAITAAMKDGTGLRKFGETFPKRFLTLA